MIWAIENDKRISAYPGIKAVCPICKCEVIPKCGEIKIWHWAHKNLQECDSWYEPESWWHINWKNQFPKECQEVSIGKHRADIAINKKNKLGNFEYSNRFIIELQNSSICSDNIRERESFYTEMCWILNGDTLAKGLELTKQTEGYVGFKWKYFPKSWMLAKKPIYVDLGEKLLQIKKLYQNEREYESSGYDSGYDSGYGYISRIIKTKKYPISGWGYLIKKEEFLNKSK